MSLMMALEHKLAIAASSWLRIKAACNVLAVERAVRINASDARLTSLMAWLKSLIVILRPDRPLPV